jgi:hypothetical protein
MERYVEARYGPRAGFAHGPADVDQILASGRLALIHCVEGGFHLGADSGRGPGGRSGSWPDAGSSTSRSATSSIAGSRPWPPRSPNLSERDHELLLPQPDQGLTALSRTAITTMAEEGVLLDVCLLSEAALEETF